MPTYSDWIHCFTSLKAEVFVSSTLFFYHFYICMSFFNHFLYPYLYYSFSIRMLFPISLSSLILLFHPLYIFIAVCHPLYHFFLSVYSPFSDRVELHISLYIIIMLSPISFYILIPFLISLSSPISFYILIPFPHIIVLPCIICSYHPFSILFPPLYTFAYLYIFPYIILYLRPPLYHFVSTSSPILFLSLRPPLYYFYLYVLPYIILYPDLLRYIILYIYPLYNFFHPISVHKSS